MSTYGPPAMGKRGDSSFRKNDAIRAVKAARDAGVEPAIVEIVAKDGTIFRVYGDNAGLTGTTSDSARTKAWDEAIALEQSKAKKDRGQ